MFQPAIKNVNININAVNQRNTVTSGDFLTGHVQFDLTKDTKITNITMVVAGKVNVHWSTGSSGKRGSSRRHFRGEVNYFKFKSVIMQDSHAVGGTAKLPPGTHVYPFTCQLPQGDFPTSFQGAHGRILYSLTVSINRPWHLSKDFVTELNFVNRIDTNQPVLRAPLSGTNTTTLCCLWCASGPISMTVSVEKKAFMPGEAVKIICDFCNASSRIMTPKVKLRQKQGFYTNGRANTRIFHRNLVSMIARPVEAHTSDVHAEIVLTIPPSTPYSISNCSILEVEYFIQVDLTATAAQDLTVLVPIILCDTLVPINPPPYQ